MQRFRNIVAVPAALSANDRGLTEAARLAAANDARLLVAWPTEDLTGAAMPPEVAREILVGLEYDLSVAVEPLRLQIANLQTRVLLGWPFIEIIRLVVREGFDLVVKTARGAKSARLPLFGATAMHLLRKCPCPVWLVDPKTPNPNGGVLAAIAAEPQKGSASVDEDILELASALAAWRSVTLHVAHAWQAPFERTIRNVPWLDAAGTNVTSYIAEIEARRRARFEAIVGPVLERQPAATVHFAKGTPTEVVTRLVRDHAIEAVVIGSVSRGDTPAMLIGRSAESIVRLVDCSVLAIKPAGFVTPLAT